MPLACVSDYSQNKTKKKKTGKEKLNSLSQMINYLHIKYKIIYEQTVLTGFSKFVELNIKPHELTMFI